MAKFVKHTIDVSAPLAPEQREMLMKLKAREPVPDDDCPEYTVEEILTQLSEKRIGAAKGHFSVPDEFDSDEWNDEIKNLFESNIK